MRESTGPQAHARSSGPEERRAGTPGSTIVRRPGGVVCSPGGTPARLALYAIAEMIGWVLAVGVDKRPWVG